MGQTMCIMHLLTKEMVLNPKIHGHTSRAPLVGIEPTSIPTQAVALPTKPQITIDGALDAYQTCC